MSHLLFFSSLSFSSALFFSNFLLYSASPIRLSKIKNLVDHNTIVDGSKYPTTPSRICEFDECLKLMRVRVGHTMFECEML